MNSVQDVTEDMAHSACAGSLIRASLGSRSCNDSDKVENKTNRSEAEDDRCDGNVDLPEVPRESTAEEQQRNLQHQRQRLHYMVEVPGDDRIEFALSILAALDSSPSYVC